MPFFGAFGNAWDDAGVARWSANPLGMFWPEMDADVLELGRQRWTPPPQATAADHHRRELALELGAGGAL